VERIGTVIAKTLGRLTTKRQERKKFPKIAKKLVFSKVEKQKKSEAHKEARLNVQIFKNASEKKELILRQSSARKAFSPDSKISKI
jgi:hypothetical protein